MLVEELIRLNRLGFIPAPGENEERFLKRVKAWQNPFEMPFPIEHELKKQASDFLAQLFDISPEWVQGFYGNQDLSFWQGAAVWEVEGEIPLPLIQLREGFKKGTYLKVYSKEEIFLHEMAHAPRLLLGSKHFEEYFAYLTSPYRWRRWLGPMFSSSKDAYLFVCLSFLPCLLTLFSFPFSYVFWGALLIPFYRLYRKHGLFHACLKKLKACLQIRGMALAVMYRLTDEEIAFFAKSTWAQIEDYIKKQKNTSLRWKVIYSCYFSVQNGVCSQEEY